MLIAGHPSISAPGLGRLGHVALGQYYARSTEDICKSAGAADWKERLSAILALSRRKDPAGTPCLIMVALKDPRPDNRQTAVMGLKYAIGDALVAQELSMVLLRDAETKVREFAALTLQTITTMKVDYDVRVKVGSALNEAATKDPEYVVRKRAEEAAIKLIEAGIVPTTAVVPPPEPIPLPPPPPPPPPPKEEKPKLSTADKIALGVGFTAMLGMVGVIAVVKSR
jgi:hypothetical protein